MKLYTKRHLLFAAAGSVLTVLAILFTVLGIFATKHPDALTALFTGSQAQEAAIINDADELTALYGDPLSGGSGTGSGSADGSGALSGSNGSGSIDAAGGRILDAAADVTYTTEEYQNISVYEKYNTAVVNISTTTIAYNWFLEPVAQDGGSGSGSIIDARGYIVTNVHVVSDAYKIYVTLSDGTQYDATVIGTDPQTDIAVIKFDPPAGMMLNTIPFGDSDTLKVGQRLLAIGNPFGFDRTLTSGIVSGLGRPIKNSSDVIIRDMIQTDSAINPGNSGGPLLDTQGRMVGINTMIYSTSGSSAGIGFAVPVNTAKRVVAELIQYGEVQRGKINGTLIPLTASIANYAKLPVSQGLLVSELKRGSKAASSLKAGTQGVQYGSRYNAVTIYLGGDVITAVDGVAVTSTAELNSTLESRKPGDSVVVTVIRDGQSVDLRLVLD